MQALIYLAFFILFLTFFQKYLTEHILMETVRTVDAYIFVERVSPASNCLRRIEMHSLRNSSNLIIWKKSMPFGYATPNEILTI